MPLASFKTSEAQINLKKVRTSIWPRGKDNDRLSGVVSVGSETSFQLVPGESIFAIGSCFARNIERQLDELGFDIVSLRFNLPQSESGSKDSNGFLNQYTAPAMVNELRWALDPETPFPEAGLLEVEPGCYIDPYLASSLPPIGRERALERRGQVTALYASIRECRVIIVTLGLVEAWFDTVAGYYLNRMPPASVQAAYPDRFRVDVLKTSEVLSSLDDLYGLLEQYGHPDFRIMITVSPVPMSATFSGKDVIATNMYSKSALRAAAEEFSLRDRVDYFPSYEIVSLTDRTLAFSEDNIHVSYDIVVDVMRAAIDRYCPQLSKKDASKHSSYNRILGLIQSEQFGKAAALLRELARENSWRAAGFSDLDFYTEFGRSLLHSGQPGLAEHALLRAVRIDRTSPRAFYLLGQARSALDRDEDAEDDFARACKLDPTNGAFHLQLARVQLANGRFWEAEASLKAAGVNSTDGDPVVPDLLAACRQARALAGAYSKSRIFARRGRRERARWPFSG